MSKVYSPRELVESAPRVTEDVAEDPTPVSNEAAREELEVSEEDEELEILDAMISMFEQADLEAEEAEEDLGFEAMQRMFAEPEEEEENERSWDPEVDMGVKTSGLVSGSVGLGEKSTNREQFIEGSVETKNQDFLDTSTGLGMVSGGLGAIGQIRDGYRSGRKFLGKNRKTWKDQSTSTNLGRVGRGGERTMKLGQTGMGLAHGGMKLAQSSSSLGTAVPVVGTVASGLDTLKSGYQGMRAMKRGNKLSKLGGEFEGHEESLEHLKEVQSKRSKRAGSNTATSGMMAVGGGLVASGVGVIPGLVLGGIGGTAKGVGWGARKSKQGLRNRKARKEERQRKALEEDPNNEKLLAKVQKRDELKEIRAKKQRGEKLSFKERRRLFFSTNEEKSTSKKDARNLETANTVLDMQLYDPDTFFETLSTLGIDREKWARYESEEDQRKAVIKALKKR